MVSASDVLARAGAAVWRPIEPVDVSDWADDNRVLVSRAAAEPGRWSTDRTPYLREFQEAFANDSIEQVTFMKASQIGGTEALYNCLFWVIDQNPGPTLFVYPNVEMARSVNRDRIIPTMRATPAIAVRLPESNQEIRGLQIKFDRMDLWFVGSNATSGLCHVLDHAEGMKFANCSTDQAFRID